MKKIQILVFLLLIGGSLLAENFSYPYDFKVKARSGDGIISLLRRYDLDNSKCNFEQFYQLNNLNKNQPLYAGRSYILPVKIYKYNNESIRSTIGIDNWDLAKSIADYNYKLKNKGVRKSTYKASGILWVPYHLVGCGMDQPDIITENVIVSKDPAPVKTPSAKKVEYKTMNVPVFGDEALVEIKSDRLKDKVFYVISGHGGPDPGAIGSCHSGDLCEDEYAYDVSLRLSKLLIQNGANVHIIIQDPNDGIRNEEILHPDKDEICINGQQIPLNQLQRLKQRTTEVNRLYQKYLAKGVKDQTAVAIHVDSRKSSKRLDVFFYHHEGSSSGRDLAYNVQETFKEKYKTYRKSGKYHGTVSSRNLYVLRNTLPTALYVELANIRNSVDQKRITRASNRQALAEWLYEGLTK